MLKIGMLTSGGNALFQCHILIHLESLNFCILSVMLYPYR